MAEHSVQYPSNTVYKKAMLLKIKSTTMNNVVFRIKIKHHYVVKKHFIKNETGDVIKQRQWFS